MLKYLALLKKIWGKSKHHRQKLLPLEETSAHGTQNCWLYNKLKDCNLSSVEVNKNFATEFAGVIFSLQVYVTWWYFRIRVAMLKKILYCLMTLIIS